MNSKIKELVVSAICNVKNEDEASKLFIGDEFADTFTKLIIQECVNNLSFHGYDDAVNQLNYLRINKFGVK